MLNNQICIPKDELIRMFWREGTKSRLNRILRRFLGKYSLVEMYAQMESGNGEVGEYFKNETENFSKKTINYEIVHSITLADFYFPESNPLICFEMKKGFSKKKINSLEELIDNIDSYTDIDCLVKNDESEFLFQLKQYPEEYKEWSVCKVIEYIDKHILPKYNSESNKNLIIIITIKPKINTNFQEIADFDKIHEYLGKKNIKLKEINFIYNRNMEFMVWYQVYPEKGHSKIPWSNLSYHQAKNSV